MRILSNLIMLLFVLVSGLGYVYFGPPQYTAPVTRLEFYRKYVEPFIDSLFAYGNLETVSVGRLQTSAGELNYRPNTEFIFLPAREGQVFRGRTLISSGEGSTANIELMDKTVLQLEENTTVLLETPREGADNSITLKLFNGSISAQKAEDSQIDIKVQSAKGSVTRLNRKSKLVAAVAKRGDNDDDTVEYMGPAVGDASDLQKSLAEGKKIIVPKDMAEAFKAADQEEARILGTNPIVSPADAKLAQEEARKAFEAEEARRAADAQKALEAQQALLAQAQAVKAAEAAQAAEALKLAEAANAMVAAKAQADAAALRGGILGLGLSDGKKHDTRKLAALTPLDDEKNSPPPADFNAPPDKNLLSRAVWAKKMGRKDEARQLMASAMTAQGYGGGRVFNDATRIAMDNILAGYVDQDDCQLAKDTLVNMEHYYGHDEKASAFVQHWKAKMQNSTCR